MRINEYELIESLNQYIRRVRWWISELRDFKIRDILEGVDGFIVLIESNNYLFQIPFIKIDTIPRKLYEKGLYINLNGLNYIEAEYSPKYFNLLEQIGLTKIELYSITGEPIYSEPLSFESTNVIAKHTLSGNEVLLVKGYRLLSKHNYEPLIYEKLSKSGFPYIPKLYRLYRLIAGDEYVVSIVTKFVENSVKAGSPFYSKFKELVDAKRLKTGFLNKAVRYDLLLKLGVVISDLHYHLNPGFSTDYFGLEPISNRDVSNWMDRIYRRYSYIVYRLDELVEKYIDDPVTRDNLEYWRGCLSKSEDVVEDAASLIEKLFTNGCKGRIHQDLHLDQMIYVENNGLFYITDFEGEPGREDYERSVKEPLIRDLATMHQSFYYLAFNTLMEGVKWRGVVKNSIDRYTLFARKSTRLRRRILKSYVLKSMIYLVYAYWHRFTKLYEGVECYSSQYPFINYYPLYLSPWVIERALYEASYELKYIDQRGGMFVIPLTALVDALLPHKLQ